jgi:group I intron endonuclease
MKKPIVSGIYKILSEIDNKVYIGSAVDTDKRKRSHFADLHLNRHSNIHLQRAYDKYGKENFSFEIIETVEDIGLLIEREDFWISFFKANNDEFGYNIRKHASSNLGMRWSDEVKKRMSESKKGEKSPRFGTKNSPETRKKISEARMGIVLSEEHKRKLSLAGLGRKRSLESIKKGAEKMRGRKLSPETIQKIIDHHADCSGENASFFGKKHTDESKRKMAFSTALSVDIISNVKKLLDDGIAKNEICEIVGVSISTVKKVSRGGYKYLYGI